jgi:hypothetical protein
MSKLVSRATSVAKPVPPLRAKSQAALERTRDAAAGGYETLSTASAQQRFAIGAINDPLEAEADRMASQIASRPAQRSLGKAGHHIQRSASSASSSEHVPVSIGRALSSPGVPLHPEIKHEMEQGFRHDFSQVRVHTDAPAQQSARALQAHAYTLRNDIVFDAGRFAPHTPNGKRLLAHELTHVVQQNNGPATLRRQAAKTDADKTIRKKVKIPRGTTSVQEFRRYAETVIFGRVMNLSWTATSALTEKYQDISKHIGEEVPFEFPSSYSSSLPTGSAEDQKATHEAATKEYQALEGEERDKINVEIDRRYEKSVDAVAGTKIKPGEVGKQAVWHSLKEQVLADRRAIAALPDDIKKILFAGGPDAPPITPENYTQLLRIANKLAELPPIARKDYLERITASTTDLDVMERSIDSYVQFQAERTKQAESHENVSKPLLGADDVYKRYRFYKLYASGGKDSLGGDASEEDKKYAESIKQAHLSALLEALKLKGYNSIQEFEAAIEAYRISFRTQAVNLALDVLARYDHMLYEEGKKLSQPGAAATIASGIASSGAAAYYEEARTQESNAKTIWNSKEPKETWWQKPYRAAKDAAASARSTAEAKVIEGSGNDPLVKERGTDREKLTGLDAAGTHAYLQETMNKRATDVRTARQEFKDDPDRVFKLPDLIAASRKLKGIEDDSTIYGEIITDYIKDENARHLLSAIAIGIVALALAFLVPGGGWVAAAALVANAAISTHQAYTAYKEYEEQERDYNLHFLAEEPSLFWVGVAIAAAALDLGIAAGAVIKQSATALKALEGPMMEFSKEGDLAKLFTKIDAADVNKALALRLKDEAKAAKEAATQAWKDVFAIGTRTNAMFPGIADPAIARPLFRALYNSVKRGIKTIASLAADAKFVGAAKEITGLTAAERIELETAFDEVKKLAEVGASKKMDDGSLLNFVDRWATNRTKPGFQTKLLEEMNAWKPLTAEQQRALDALNAQKRAVTALYDQKEAALGELAELRAKTVKTPEDVAEIRSIEKELGKLDPRWDPSAKAAPGKGKIAEAESTLAAREADAAKAELSLYDRLRAASPGDKASAKALSGVTRDPLGLKTPPGPLRPDHIVSVDEIADMDGFKELLWKDQKEIADMDGLIAADKFGNRSNLIAMDKAANESKGARSWRSWKQAPHFYDQASIDLMVLREAEVRAAIQTEIKNRLAKLATKP